MTDLLDILNVARAWFDSEPVRSWLTLVWVSLTAALISWRGYAWTARATRWVASSFRAEPVEPEPLEPQTGLGQDLCDLLLRNDLRGFVTTFKEDDVLNVGPAVFNFGEKTVVLNNELVGQLLNDTDRELVWCAAEQRKDRTLLLDKEEARQKARRGLAMKLAPTETTCMGLPAPPVIVRPSTTFTSPRQHG